MTVGPMSYGTDGVVRAALYVSPGDFERRGVSIDSMNQKWAPAPGMNTETQYMVSGARVVWKNSHVGSDFLPDARITYSLGNLIQSTTGVVDLVSGELLERTTFYPNGARETLRSNQSVVGRTWQLEPVGFTGKEGDDEVGLVYFGERYLLPHLGRWASPDPLQVHQGGGGEFGNSFHYVSGNLLQARDPLGLSGTTRNYTVEDTQTGRTQAVDADEAGEASLQAVRDGVRSSEQAYFEYDAKENRLFVTEEGTRADPSELSDSARMWIEILDEGTPEVVFVPIFGYATGPVGDAYGRPVTLVERGLGAERLAVHVDDGQGGTDTVRPPIAVGEYYGITSNRGECGGGTCAFFASVRPGTLVRQMNANAIFESSLRDTRGFDLLDAGNRAQARYEARVETAVTALHEAWLHVLNDYLHRTGTATQRERVVEEGRRVEEAVVRARRYGSGLAEAEIERVVEGRRARVRE